MTLFVFHKIVGLLSLGLNDRFTMNDVTEHILTHEDKMTIQKKFPRHKTSGEVLEYLSLV